ncbi:MAG: YjjG family noncanonical pyrimidine nucleotidase [Flavobacteriales bacterium]
MTRYRHIFFDLDHTLWDFTGNSRATLRELFVKEGLADAGVPDADSLIEVYEEVNKGMWEQLGTGRMTKEVLRVLRFRNTLTRFGVNNGKLTDRLGHAYLERCPQKAMLMPGAAEMLRDVHPHYRLHIITNGFDEVQHVKLKSSGIAQYFTQVLTSEKAGAHKPDPRIFSEALRVSKATAQESLMVGDNAGTDMLGARNAGWDQVHFAAETEPDALATHRITRLDELRAILL